jgi:folate-binding protein YgfZ
MAGTDLTPGYGALLHGAGILDLSARGRIRVTGEDRARLLHAMTTNHVQQMKAGDGLYTFFLNAQGRILADAYILCFSDHLLLDTEPETREAVFQHLDHYIIADDVSLEDVGGDTCCIALEGPACERVAGEAGLPSPNSRYSHAEWGDASVARIAMAGKDGVRIYAPARRRDELIQSLEADGGISASAEEADAVRIRNFRPRYGRDISDGSLPQETQQMQAVHFQKGCYLGQEIVERIRSRGHVNKTLMGFALDSPEAPAKGARLLAADKEAGEVTSAAVSPDGQSFGLAVVRVPWNRPGEAVSIRGHRAELFAPAEC